MITTDHTALLAAIDAGDDSALPTLADLLEERGEVRAAGLRSLIGSGRQPGRYSERPVSSPWYWSAAEAARQTPEEIPWHAMGLLRGVGWDRYEDGVWWVCYPTRSAAFLALARALAES